MKEIRNLFKMRESLDRYEEEIGIAKLSNLEKSILEFIASTDNPTITLITKTDYFKKYSFSSIKRGVNSLIEYKLVRQDISQEDKRNKFLVCT